MANEENGKVFASHVDSKTGRVQSVQEHNHNVAEHTRCFLSDIGLGATGEFVGACHDLGKLKDEFDQYVRGISGAARGSVIHTFFSVQHLLRHYHDPNGCPAMSDVAAELLAFAMGAHHGLFDCFDLEHAHDLCYRRDHTGDRYDEIACNMGETGKIDFDRQFQAAVSELDPMLNQILDLAEERGDDDLFDGEASFYTGMLARVILSALVDGDRRDAAAFSSGVTYPKWLSDSELETFWSEKLGSIEARLSGLLCESELDGVRHAISDACADAASEAPGVFLLHVQTGGGKTLSGLRFAVKHAMMHKMRRVIFTAPRLSILDQNASVWRDYIQDDGSVLEHHSNVVNLNSGKSGYKERVALSEGWDSPFVITTSVQFLNNLFSGDMDCVRRLHAMCRSVILIDEVQAIPDNQLTLFSLAVTFLTRICGSTVVLCSATQPALDKIRHSIIYKNHELLREIRTPCAKYLHLFQRVSIMHRAGSYSLDDISDMVPELLDQYGSVVVVCNMKKQASGLYDRISSMGLDGSVFHLSASMCQAHRKDMMKVMKKRLSNRERVICVSTQVIEAGVDISFGAGIRFLAGLDSVIQTAGRVNRSWELGAGNMGVLQVVSCRDENLRNLPDIQETQRAMQALLAAFDLDPAQFDGCLDSDKAVAYYYKCLYAVNGHRHEYKIGRGDNESLYDLLSRNDQMIGCDTPEQYMRQAFKTAGSRYQVFGSGTFDVIVDYDKKSTDLITRLNGEAARNDLRIARRLLHEARPYTVSLFEHDIRTLQGTGLIELPGGAFGLFGHYDRHLGVVVEKWSPDENIC